MKNFNQFRLGNRVLIDERLLGTDMMEEGFIKEISGLQLKIKHRKSFIDYDCNSSQVYPIELTDGVLVSLGFTNRSLVDSTGTKIEDKVCTTDQIENSWYLLSIIEKADKKFLTVYENGKDVIGSGFVNTLHKLQNLVFDITDGKVQL